MLDIQVPDIDPDYIFFFPNSADHLPIQQVAYVTKLEVSVSASPPLSSTVSHRPYSSTLKTCSHVPIFLSHQIGELQKHCKRNKPEKRTGNSITFIRGT
jgi:hypothetical protein